jgi:hypothetical protein
MFGRGIGASLVAWMVVACSAPTEPEAGLPVPYTHGRIHVLIAVGEVDGGAQVTGQVDFLRYWEVDGETANILAGGSPRVIPTPGWCQVSTPDQHLDDALGSIPERAHVEHLDGGDVLVNVDDVAVGSIAPHSLPALYPYVTGVEYDELLLTDLERGLSQGAEVGVTAFGGDDVKPFNVIATAPEFPQQVSARYGEALEITWHVPAQTLGKHTRAKDYVVISVGSEFGAARLGCFAEDDGSFTIEPEALAALGPWDKVAIERVRRVPFRAEGIMWGELEVSVRHVVTAFPSY